MGPSGSQLSGGQKQRIALARAFLKPAPIILLDEATSSLDALTESSITKELNFLGKNRTMIIVAHKLSTIQDADKIIVLDEGKICEAGTHTELLKLGRQYAELFSAQQSNSK